MSGLKSIHTNHVTGETRRRIVPRGSKGGGKGDGGDFRAPIEAPNSLQSAAHAKVIEVLSEGPIKGIVPNANDSIFESIFYNNTAIESSDGTFNFVGLDITFKPGIPNQLPIPGFSRIEAEKEINPNEVTTVISVTYTTQGGNELDAVRPKLRIDSLNEIEEGTGDLVGTVVEVQMEIASWNSNTMMFNPFVKVRTIVTAGKTTAPYEDSFRLNLPKNPDGSEGAPWQIKMVRNTQDQPEEVGGVQNRTRFPSITELIDEAVTYESSAIVATEIDARQFGTTIPSRTYLVEGLLVNIPSNYDPDTRLYDGIWDGTFNVAYSNNPAWVYYDIVTNRRYGLGRVIDASRIDKFLLYTIAKECDRLVEDGRGGFEPLFTFNGILNTREDAITVLQTILSNFHAILYWGEGSIKVSQDAASDLKRIVTKANVINGEFVYGGTGLQGRHSRVKVTWFNPDDGYRTAIEFVEDDEMLDRFGDNDAEIYAVGCTSQGQAARHGRWFLDNERYASRTISYSVSLENALVRPGELVEVLDETIAGFRMGGRVAAVVTGGTHTITLDAPFTFQPSTAYTLEVVLPTDAPIDPDNDFDPDPDPDLNASRHPLLEKLNVTVAPGVTTNVVTLDGLYSTTPLSGAMFALSEPTLEPSQWRVISIKEKKRGAEYEINAVQHDPNKYRRIEEDIDLPPIDISNLPTGAIPAPSDLDCAETLYEPGNVAVSSKVTLSWSAASAVVDPRFPDVVRPDPRVTMYEVQMLRPNAETWQPIGTPSGGNDGFVQGIWAEGLEISAGVYSFRVRSYDNFSRKSQWVTKTEALLGLSAPPGDVQNFSTVLQTDQVELSWNKVTDLDMRGYILRFSPLLVGATWAGAQPLGAEMSKETTSKSIIGLVGTYMIKAIDTTENVSFNAAQVQIASLGDIGLNQAATFEEHPTWGGIHTDTEVIGNTLRLASLGTMSSWIPLSIAIPLSVGAGFAASGMYEALNTIDLGGVFFSRVSSELHVDGLNLNNVMASWLPMSSVLNLSGVVEGQVGAIVEFRFTEDDPGGSPVWSSWQELVTGEVRARAFEFRLLLFTNELKLSPIVTFWGVTIDMPDRVVSGEQITVPAIGATIPFSPPFLSPRPAVTVTGSDMAEGDFMVLDETSINQDEFSVRFHASGGAGKQIVMDYIARGYGAEL